MKEPKYGSVGSRLAFLLYAWGGINGYKNLCGLLTRQLSISSYLKNVEARTRQRLAGYKTDLKGELKKPILPRASGSWKPRYQNRLRLDYLRRRIREQEAEIGRIKKETKGIRRMLRRYPGFADLF